MLNIVLRFLILNLNMEIQKQGEQGEGLDNVGCCVKIKIKIGYVLFFEVNC